MLLEDTTWLASNSKSPIQKLLVNLGSLIMEHYLRYFKTIKIARVKEQFFSSKSWKDHHPLATQGIILNKFSQLFYTGVDCIATCIKGVSP